MPHIPRADWNGITSGNPLTNCICLNASTFIFTCSVDQKIYQATYDPLTIVNSVSLAGQNATIALVGNGSAIVGYGGLSQYDVIQLSTMYKTSITTNAGGVANQTFNTLVANASGYAIAPNSTNSNSFRLINCNTGTASSFVNVLPSTAGLVNVFGAKDSNFLIAGVSNSTVYEVNMSGQVVGGNTVPTTPNNGTTPSLSITGMQYASPNLALLTDRGSLVVMNWNASSFVNEFYTYNSFSAGFAQSATTMLSPAASGNMYIVYQVSGVQQWNSINEFQLGGNNPQFIDTLYDEHWANGLCWVSQEPINGRLVTCSSDTSNYGTYKLRVNDILPLNQINVSTRAQFPLGNDIGGNIIRIRDKGPGRSIIDTDVTVLGGAQNLPANQSNDYIELFLNGLSGTSEKWDVRSFKA